MDQLTLFITIGLISVTVVPYVIRLKRKERAAIKRFEELKVSGLHLATTMHPHIDAIKCIGCGGCASACPEGDVIAIIQSKAVLVHGSKCVGHGLCAEACPVGGIEMLMAPPGKSADLPILTDKLETTVAGIFIAGELGGMGLIKNAVVQGKSVIETIALRSKAPGTAKYDVAIIGAGPAGMAATLTAQKHNLRYVVLEQGDIGGTILQYPRRKIVMTSPVDLPLWGKLKLTETSKENLLEVWTQIIEKTGVRINTNEKVTDIVRSDGGAFTLTTSKGEYTANNIVLALGRRGTPRKLGVPGEKQAKVMYRLIDAETYQNCDVMVVGGGDSAIEAAVGLALQGTNRVTLSYRKSEFSRIKDRNAKHLAEYVSSKKLIVEYNSEVLEILPDVIKLQTPAGVRDIANQWMFIFAGGEMPFEFLKKVGVEFQARLVK